MDTQPRDSDTPPVHLYFDVIIVGAGIAGINAAYRLQSQGPPGLTYVILESRTSIGGTWDLFRYPGIRSDSDIYTFGFKWNPWDHRETLATGGQIKDYIVQSAHSTGIDENICYRHTVSSANWLSPEKCWELGVIVPGEDEPVHFRSRFLILGTGYYDYETPLQADIPGIENFQGRVIHPQFWPKDYDYTDEDVVVIGSGATAITIVPSIADRAKRVTMLQRSPGYIFSFPRVGLLTILLFAVLPDDVARSCNRVAWLLWSYFTTLVCKSFPSLAKMLLKYRTMMQLPSSIKWDPNFKPTYNPWEQRFCASNDGDFFAALRSGKADVVTGNIRMINSKGIELTDGTMLHPDAIVTATGLKLRFGGGIKFAIDGCRVDVTQKFSWKACMLQDLPNLWYIAGYETASWTLGADVSAELFVRLLNLMDQRQTNTIVPRAPRGMNETSMTALTSTYVQCARDVLPKGGTGHWGQKSNYITDMARAKWGDITTDLEFM